VSTSEEAQLAAESFIETLRSEANTGGARVVGVQMLGGSATANMYAMIPKTWANIEKFCVRTNSSDGLYDSVNTYIVPEDLSEPVDVRHFDTSQHQDRIRQFHAEGLGVRISQNACDSEAVGATNVVARWQDAEPTDKFAIFVNSFDADRLIAYPPTGDGVECRPISADITVAYDMRCELDLLGTSEPYVVELQPVKNGRRGRIETLVIDFW
jgi:hypothetical protein